MPPRASSRASPSPSRGSDGGRGGRGRSRGRGTGTGTGGGPPPPASASSITAGSGDTLPAQHVQAVGVKRPGSPFNYDLAISLMIAFTRFWEGWSTLANLR